MEKNSRKKVVFKPDNFKLKDKIVFSGLTNTTAKTALTYSLLPKLFEEGIVLWWVKDEQEKNEVTENLYFWQEYFQEKIKIFDFHQIDGLTLYSLGQKKERTIFIFTAEDILPEVPNPKKFRESLCLLEKGKNISPAQLSQSLIRQGYQFDRFASAPGHFTRKGNLLDLFNENSSHPIRIEFFNNEIEKINFFDEKTKKTIKKIEQIIVIPKTRNYLKNESHVFDYINMEKATLIASDPEKDSDLFKQTKKARTIFFHALGKKSDHNFGTTAAPYFHNNLKKFANILSEFHQKGFKIFLATHKEKELKELFKNYKINFEPEFLTISNRFIEGFISKDQKVAFLTDSEIFGQSLENGEYKNKKTSFDLIYELKPGDYVVHLDHGIGRFLGIVKRKIGEYEKEYFSLIYAEKDKLFVPIENADKITKYIGGARPNLHRLSGTSWLQMTYKVKKSAEKAAHELIKLYAAREIAKAIPLEEHPAEEKELEESFIHEETSDQARAIGEVLSDLGKDKPTDRLICGDVGFGKTEVAVRAAFRAFLNRKQVALLSPTTLLTQQHYDTFQNRLKKFGPKIAILSRVQSRSEQEDVVAKLKNGLIDIVIGTHRLLSSDIKFKDLGLIIIDEEQRFGVKDKERLKNLRSEAHILTLSATPIPRTLNFSLTGLRDISLIQTPPLGRKTVATEIISYSEKKVKEAILKELKRKGQIYYLHNRVETIQIKAKHIKKLVPQAKIGIAHGQLNEKELMEAMRKFDNQETNLLVCSTIIENGLDLPNANTLIVENATRFGLGDLYQLRGRIGRSDKKAFAFFLYHSKKLKETAKKRLKALLEAKELGSGFQLALRDLQIRGSGNILGHKQSGHIKAIGLNLYVRLLNQAIQEAKTGKIQRPVMDVNIDLPITFGIPDNVIPDQSKRLKVYQEMANFLDIKELEQYRFKFIKKYEQEPEAVKNLFGLLKLKITAQKAKVKNISCSKTNYGGDIKEKILITFAENIKPDMIEKLINKNQAWDFTGDQIKIEKDKLGEKWLPNLTNSVRLFI